jgi:hypothetical protein
MPPRWVSAVIIAGWIAAVGWLFRVEIWPSLEPGAPPPYTIDLVDEAQTEKVPIRWIVSHNDEKVMVARTSVEHRGRENDFTLRAIYEPRNLQGVELNEGSLVKITMRHMISAYRVTPEGQLLGVEAEIDLDAEVFRCTVRISGEVHGGEFAPNLEVQLPGRQLARKLQPVRVSSQGSVVMPLHPVNRINGLRLGESWRVPVFDPVSDSLTTIGGGDGRVRFLRARIRPQVEIMNWNRADVRCLVIDYQEESAFQDDRITAETWVSAEDGRVLKQVAKLSDGKWVMERE